ncbi:MAG: FkbM family methyltransferase [Thermoplasmata archaeon]|jgi:FkbM family methyltransferase
MGIEEDHPNPVRAHLQGLARQSTQSLTGLTNWPAYWMARFLGRPITLRFRQGSSFPKATRDEAGTLLFLSANGVKFAPTGDPTQLTWGLDPRDRIITTPTGIRFHLPSADGVILAETYLYDIHYAGDLRGKTVIDVGANVGDTALYFAEQGAEVFAYEPDPTNFEGLRANLDLNPTLRPHIHPFPYAAGADGEVEFHVGLRGGSSMYETGGTVRRVKAVSLETILGGRDRVHLLKADCKGAEHELARQPAIGRFDHVAIEYYWIAPGLSAGETPLTALLARLRKQGFGRWRVFKHNAASTPLSQHGMLAADHDRTRVA